MCACVRACTRVRVHVCVCVFMIVCRCVGKVVGDGGLFRV